MKDKRVVLKEIVFWVVGSLFIAVILLFSLTAWYWVFKLYALISKS